MSFTLDDVLIAELGWRSPSSAFHPGPTPVAGVGFTYSAPGTERQMVLGVSFRLVSSADVATRTAFFSFSDGSGNVYLPISAPFTQTASHTVDYTFAVGIQQAGANDGARISAGIPPVTLDVGYGVKIDVTNIQAADQISAVRVLLSQWPVRP